jgi:MraZ protein
LFRGQYLYSVDSKGRVSIPAKLRKHINPEANDTIVMTQGTSKCILIYPYDQWQTFENDLLRLNPYVPDNMKFIRMTTQKATEDVLDSQARILIPQFLLEYAGIEKEVLIIGVLNKIELWDPAVYDNYINSSEETYEQLAEKVMANGK